MIALAFASENLEDLIFSWGSRRSAKPRSKLKVVAFTSALATGNCQFGESSGHTREPGFQIRGCEMGDDVDEGTASPDGRELARVTHEDEPMHPADTFE